MTYYTLPKLFKYNDNNNNSIIKNIIVKINSLNDIVDNSLLEKLLNTLIDNSSKDKYNEIKNKYSFTNLLNLKISDEIYHPKSYFAFIEINKICKFFKDDNKLVILNMSLEYDYLDALYQIRNNDRFILSSEHYHTFVPEYICLELTNTLSLIKQLIKKYHHSIDLISINYDNINLTLKNILIGLFIQKKGGNMVIKFKRLTSKLSKEIIYLLMSLYENVLIIKPKIINSVNEYKYIIASNFNNILSIDNYDNILNIINIINNLNDDNIVTQILKCEIPQILINKVDECELIMSENILTTHMKILNSIHVNNVNIKSVEKKAENDSKLWLKENNS
jgi:hypothetical protein